MNAWRATVDKWLGGHHGIITAVKLRELGCSERTLRRMTAAGELVVVYPGVFRSSQSPDGVMPQLVALCDRHPDALIACTTGSKLWGWRRIEDERTHILVPHGSAAAPPGVIVHRCRKIDPVDIVHRPDGIRVTSPPRTLFDSAELLGRSATRSVLEQILHERTCTLETVIDTYLRLSHPRRPGSTVLGDVLSSRPKWRAALQSDLEHRVDEAIRRHGMSTPVAQCPVALPSGRTIHLDFGWPQWKVGLEVDDPSWHAGEAERHRDTNRDRKAGTVGWFVARVTKLDINGALDEAVADLAAIIDLRKVA